MLTQTNIFESFYGYWISEKEIKVKFDYKIVVKGYSRIDFRGFLFSLFFFF